MKDKLKFKYFGVFLLAKRTVWYDLLRKHLLNVTQDWNRLPREIVESPVLEVSKT